VSAALTAHPLLEPVFARRNRVLMGALLFSAALHGGLMLLKFTAPDTYQRLIGQSPLEVVLVNAKHSNAPVVPQALAQVNLDGGGDNEQGLARSPLPDSGFVQDGTDLQQVKARVAELEAEQRRLLAALQDLNTTKSAVQQEVREAVQASQTTEDESALARKIAALEKRVEDYNKRPRRKFITPSTREVVYAGYYVNWRERIEKVGTENYPPEARGKIYGDAIVTVSILANGQIESIDVDRASHPVLKKAAERIVKLSGPFKPFTPEMAAQYQVFVITTRFVFTRGEGFETRNPQ
jgi:protein TonB